MRSVVSSTVRSVVPTTAEQTAVLNQLRSKIEPLIASERLPASFVLKPGTRLTRAYGRCTWKADQAEITVRCTADGDRAAWRRTGAIVGTLLHELAHLRYRSHGPRFWALHRRLVDRAVHLGIYDPGDRDPAERGRGDEKLATSAASIVARQARQARHTRTRANRAAVQTWQAGARAVVSTTRGRLAGALVTVLALRRTRLLVETLTGRRYLVSPDLLVNPSSVPMSATMLTAAPSQK
ncbi:MAG TPA: Wss1p-related putative metallopeptidase [Chloroflexota bacterium]